MRKNTEVFVAVSAALLALLAGNAPSFAQNALSGSVKEQINTVQSAIQKKGAKWVAGETSLSNLSREDWMYRVGLNFQTITAPPIEEPALQAPAPASLDWRDNNGNYVSPITNQKKCGSCWAFAMTAGLEAFFIALPYALGDRIAVFSAVQWNLGALGFSGRITGWAMVTLIVVLPASIVAGFQFPMLIALLGRGRKSVGR